MWVISDSLMNFLLVFDKMSLFNNQLKKITLKELLILIIVLFLVQFTFSYLNIFYIDYIWIYFLVILFFVFRLRNSLKSVKNDIWEVFEVENIKMILYIVLVNIFISYLCLYISNFILYDFGIYNVFNTAISASLIAAVFISPVSEELIFRGVFLNRLKLIVPTIVSILISALIFASLHTWGSIFSSFIFAVSMSILYLKTDNIFMPMTAHFLNNLAAEIIVTLDANNIIFTNSAIITIVSILGISSFILILVWFVKQLNTIKD